MRADANLTVEYVDRVLLLDDGRLVQDGRPAEVMRKETLEAVYRTGERDQLVAFVDAVLAPAGGRLFAGYPRAGQPEA